MRKWSLTALGVTLVVAFVYFRALASVEEAVTLEPERSTEVRSTPGANLELAPVERPLTTRDERVVHPVVREDELRGLVLDPHGEPCPDADVVFVWKLHGRARESRVRSGPAGTFRFELSRPGVRGMLLANSSSDWAPGVLEDVVSGSEVVLHLNPQRTFEVELVDALGERLEPTTLDIFWVLNGLTVRGDTPEARLWRIPPVPFRMYASASGTDAGWFGPFAPSEVGPVLRLTARRLPRVRGRVLARGKPVMGSEVELEPLSEMLGGVSRLPAGAFTWSNSEGHFEFVTRSTGAFLPRAHFAAIGSGRGSPVTLDGTSDVDELVIELTDAPGTIAGQVLLPAGHAFAEIRVAEVNDRRARSPRLDGSFELPGVEAGTCWLTVRAAIPELAHLEHHWSTGVTRAPPWLAQEYFWSVRVVPGQTSRVVLDLTRPPACRVEGRLDLGTFVHGQLDVVGATAANLELRTASGKELAASLAFDTTRPFVVGVEEPGTYSLQVLLGFPATELTWCVREALELAPGKQAFELVLRTGALRVLPLDEDHALPREIAVTWRDGGREIAAYNPLMEHERGSLLFAYLPPGRVSITLPGLSAPFEAQVEAGALTEFTFPAAAHAEVRAALAPFLAPLPFPHEIGY